MIEQLGILLERVQNRNEVGLRTMSHEAKFQATSKKTLHSHIACSHTFLGDSKTFFEKLLMCYQSGLVA